jgi:Mannosyltransferase (PIG-V)
MLQRKAIDEEATYQAEEAAYQPVQQQEAIALRAPGAGDLRGRLRSRLPNLGPDDLAALGMWGAAHLALLVLAWAAAWTFRSVPSHAPLTGVFEHWDASLLRNIAQHGYFSPGSIPHNVAFFPGYPAALAGAHVILRNWVLSELAVSAVAGCFAVVSLARLAAGRRAVLYLLTAPAAIFLTVGYSESLFLALAIPAWHAATRGRWWRAALLAGLAGLVRPDALFLIPALAVMALTGPRGTRLANAAKACGGLAGSAAYEAYLTVHTGTVLAWSKAMQAGWGLHQATPLQSLRATWSAAFGHQLAAGIAFEFQLELATMAAMVLATLAFACWGRWPETVYCGLAVLALGTSTWYQGCPRTLMLLFPVWIALARLDARRAWIRYVYLSVSAPLAVVLGLLFLAYQWAG